jgi:hypothetical protein
MTFRVVSTSPNSAISAETVFHFCEDASSVGASYSGGLVVRGHFVGRRTRSDELVLAYAQLHRDGELKTGSSVLRVERHEHGLRLTESYKWSDGSDGENVLVSVNQPR